ncbi:nucleotidyl transferase AbiEii/AbiGii toxin family protein [Nonomuraea sp. NPDC059194]|uniref:nucleotidyl transferase AbiEii/AbiGii toxin family protein n=1 Tax=Nonomuraea sp. NPDC059194 TaxID=3346764 RepID=UPI0036C14838
MDPLHERLARIGLAATGKYGFALAGGYAVQAHGFLTRKSEDVDLFTTTQAEPDFDKAVNEIVEAYRADGLSVDITLRFETFARLQVTTPESQSSKVELGVDWRAHPPTFLEIGPVLHSDDAVANKVCALFGRSEVRDYVDVHAILASGRYTGTQLLSLAADHDPGFDTAWFANALRYVERLPHSAFAVYGMSTEQAGELRQALTGWAETIAQN